MPATPIRGPIVAAVACLSVVVLGGCASSPADRVADALEGTDVAGAVSDPDVVDAYGPRLCTILRGDASFTVEDLSAFLASAPPGTLGQLPAQGLTDGQLTELNRAVVAEYCPDQQR